MIWSVGIPSPGCGLDVSFIEVVFCFLFVIQGFRCTAPNIYEAQSGTAGFS